MIIVGLLNVQFFFCTHEKLLKERGDISLEPLGFLLPCHADEINWNSTESVENAHADFNLFIIK